MPKANINGATDFADVAYWILRSRFSNGETLNVHQVNLHLDNIATKHAENDPSIQFHHFQ